MKLYFVLILAFLVGCTLSPDKWTNQDYALQAGVLATGGVDWLQTREIASNDNYYERNPILGKNPSKKEVDLFFLAGAVLKIVTVHYTQKKYRPYLQTGYIIGSTICIVNNHAIGVRIDF